MVKPETGQAKRDEKTIRSCVSFLDLLAPLVALRQCFVGQLRDTMPSERPSAGLYAIGQACGHVRAHNDAVDDDVDVVLVFLVELRRVQDLGEFAVHLDALKTLLHQLGKLLAELALAALDEWGEQIQPRAFSQRHDAVDHLRDGLALDRQTGGRRVRDADARKQQAHVVVDLGDGADGRARIAAGGFLLDGDRRRQPVDVVDIRLLHHFEELARIGRQALDVAALALGIDGVEGER